MTWRKSSHRLSPVGDFSCSLVCGLRVVVGSSNLKRITEHFSVGVEVTEQQEAAASTPLLFMVLMDMSNGTN
ncbi:hypothetical protein GN956_G21913 [Arapaima gigas]